MNGIRAGRLAGTALATLLGLAGGSAAQDGEMVVTAQKREERLQEVPIAITAFTGAELDRLGVDDVQDIARRTPGLQFGNFSDLKLSPTALRGVSAISGSAGQDPSVGVYLDEIFLGQGVGANIDYFDLARVEVLRGPQGTLFGRNTIGGLISITTRAPTQAFEAYAEGEYGDFDWLRFRAAISGPLIENVLAVRVAGSYLEREGFTENVFRGVDGDDDQNRNIRGSVLFTPTDELEFLLVADYRESERQSKLFETLRYDPTSTFFAAAQAFGVQLNLNPFDRRVFSDLVSNEEVEAYGGSLRITYDFADGGSVTSVTGYREHDYTNIGDTDMSPLRWIYDGDPEEVTRFSQELRYASPTDGVVDVIAGLYYFDQESSNLSFIEVGSDLSLALTGRPTAINGLRAGSDATLEVESYAAFLSATINLTDQWDVLAGARYTYEEKRIDYLQTDPLALLGGAADIVAENDFNALTPSFTSRYRWSEDSMVYGTISRGFKSGGFNDALGDADGIFFGPETLTNYELGAKASFVDGTVTVNAALFYMEWTDIQINADDPATPVFDPRTSNAGAAHSQGLEVEARWFATEQLDFGLSASFLEAEYDEGTLPTAPGTTPIPLADLPRSPEYKIGVNGTYVVPLGFADLTLFGEAIFTGEQFLAPTADPDARVDAYTIVNGRLALEDPGGMWSLSIWGENIFDETYKERLFNLLDNNSIIGQKLIVLNPPRIYGIRARFEF